MKNLNYLLLIAMLLNFTNLLAKDIPVIVISPGKTLQSKGIVGSDVEVVDRNTISNSSQLFIGDVLDNNLNGLNYFQQGGISVLVTRVVNGTFSNAASVSL